MTLLEVVLALAIFSGSLAVLSQLAWNGSRAALQGRLHSQAVMRCEAKLAEVVCGAVPLQNTSPQPYPDDPRWSWSLNLGQTQYAELVIVEVTVTHEGGSSLGNVTQKLTRWMRDPALFEAALEAQMAAEQESSSSSGSSTSSSSGSQ